MARFSTKGSELFIDGKKVLHGWESFSDWYWFATERVSEQISVINGRNIRDTIWFGFVQGHFEEWGNFSQAELELLAPRVWEIPPKTFPIRAEEPQGRWENDGPVCTDSGRSLLGAPGPGQFRGDGKFRDDQAAA